MPEIGTPGLTSGDGKRGVGHWPQATAPILDSTPQQISDAKYANWHFHSGAPKRPFQVCGRYPVKLNNFAAVRPRMSALWSSESNSDAKIWSTGCG